MSRPVVELAPGARAGVAAAISTLVPVEARAFLSALELGYLAASADGFDATEREMLAGILQDVTPAELDHGALAAHFADLDEAVAVLGRRERLARNAADFETDDARAAVVQLAALIAMADGMLAEDELAVLAELGGCFQWAPTRVRALVDAAAGSLGGAS